MKLELKHLAPYLPYGLKCKFESEDFDHLIVGIEDTIDGVSLISPFNDYGKTDISKVKPILRPLSDLTKEISYGLSTYAFINLFEIGDCDGCVFEFEHGNIKTIKALEGISKYNLYNDINYLPNAVVNMMHEYHFDVLGLIEKGLAIDINTLENV